MPKRVLRASGLGFRFRVVHTRVDATCNPLGQNHAGSRLGAFEFRV